MHIKVVKSKYELSTLLSMLVNNLMLPRINSQEEIRTQYGQIHDEHTCPWNEFLFGYMCHLDVDRVVHVNEREEQGGQDRVILKQVRVGEVRGQVNYSENQVKREDLLGQFSLTQGLSHS